jgi:hypothetical protein
MITAAGSVSISNGRKINKNTLTNKPKPNAVNNLLLKSDECGNGLFKNSFI